MLNNRPRWYWTLLFLTIALVVLLAVAFLVFGPGTRRGEVIFGLAAAGLTVASTLHIAMLARRHKTPAEADDEHKNVDDERGGQ